MATAQPTTTRPFSPAAYNGLMDVSTADRRLWSRQDREAFFQEAGTLICENGLQESVGLCLLHNHNAVAEGHIMVESFETDTYATPALVMAHTPRDQARQPVPVALKVGDGGLLPLEYSSVDLAHRNYRLLQEAGEDFVAAFCDVVTRNGFEDLVGLSVLRVDALDRQPDEELVERTDSARVANVLRAHDTVEAPNINHVQTSWVFDKVEATAASNCVTKCLAKCATKCEAPNSPEEPHLEEHLGQEHEGSGSHIPPR